MRYAQTRPTETKWKNVNKFENKPKKIEKKKREKVKKNTNKFKEGEN